MEKRFYDAPAVEIIHFSKKDGITTTSSGATDDDVIQTSKPESSNG